MILWCSQIPRPNPPLPKSVTKWRNLSKFKQSVNCQKINPLTDEFLRGILFLCQTLIEIASYKWRYKTNVERMEKLLEDWSGLHWLWFWKTNGLKSNLKFISVFFTNVLFNRGHPRTVSSTIHWKHWLFRQFTVLLRYPEMHSKGGYNICICSVILGEVNFFRNYKSSLLLARKF